MIPGLLREATLATLEELKQNGVAESTTLEYKSELPGGTDEQRKEFLKDISAFANTGGGDIAFGIQERGGVIENVAGVECEDPDRVVLDLENRLRDGMDPRLPSVEFRHFEIAPGKRILLIRVARSWFAPHRVTFKGHSHFYARGAAGVYAMNVQQLRDAFTASSMLTERIRAFREERVSKIIHSQTPVRIEPEGGRPLAILHLIPMTAFADGPTIDIASLSERLRDFAPLGFRKRDGTSRLNLEGRVNFAGNNSNQEPRWRSYTQVYRSGVVEAVTTLDCNDTHGHRYVSPRYEGDLRGNVPDYLKLLGDLGIGTPIYAFLTLARVGDAQLSYDRSNASRDPFDRSEVLLPEVVIELVDTPIDDFLKPILDMVWNAVGHATCPRYSADGRWQSW